MTQADPQHSFKRRYLYKLATNLIGLLLTVLQAGIVPRALGPKAYGDFNFLINFFNQFVQFLEMKSSNHLYNSLTVAHKERNTAALYFWIVAAVSVATAAFVLVAIATSAHTVLWPGQDRLVIFLCAILSLFFWHAELLAKVCDALGFTVSLEKFRLGNRIFFFLGLGLLMWWGLSDIRSYLSFQFAANIILILTLLLLIKRTGAFRSQRFNPSAIDAGKNLRAIFAYSHPMFVYALLGLGANYIDRWLLQRFGGSIEQGLFSLAYNIGMAFNAFINAIYPLIMREFSIAFAENNLKRAAEVFRKLIPAAYTLTAFFLCFAAVNSEAVIRAVGGKSFGDAAMVFSIMAMLPVMQNYSLLSGSVLYASNKTKLLRNIGMIMTPIGVAATYFLLTPRSFGGLGQGAVGLAVKTVALEFIGNNIVLFFNSRILGLKFHRYLLHQIYVVALFLAVAYCCKWGLGFTAFDVRYAWLWKTGLGGGLYVCICLSLIYFAPVLFGIDKRQILDLLAKQLTRFKKK